MKPDYNKWMRTKLSCSHLFSWFCKSHVSHIRPRNKYENQTQVCRPGLGVKIHESSPIEQHMKLRSGGFLHENIPKGTNLKISRTPPHHPHTTLCQEESSKLCAEWKPLISLLQFTTQITVTLHVERKTDYRKSGRHQPKHPLLLNARTNHQARTACLIPYIIMHAGVHWLQNGYIEDRGLDILRHPQCVSVNKLTESLCE